MKTEPFVFAKIVVIRFPAEQSERPVISWAIRNYDLDFNILRANVVQGREGMLVIEFRGHRRNVEEALKYFQAEGIQVKTVGQEVRRNEEVCYHCGICAAVCPAGALTIDYETMKVVFKQDKCMACEVCVTACPPRAMEVGHSVG